MQQNLIKEIEGVSGCNFPADFNSLIAAGLTTEQANSELETHRIELQWALVRKQREPLLEQAEHAINDCNDRGHDDAAWRAYRVALKDIPQSQNDPFNINWPVMPA